MIFAISKTRSVVILLSFFSIIYGDVIEDTNQIKNVSDAKSFLEVFEPILRQKIQNATPQNIEKVKSDTDQLLASFNCIRSMPVDFESTAWSLYPQFIKSYLTLNDSEIPMNQHFIEKGFIQGTIPQEFIHEFLNEFKSAKAIPFRIEDFDLNYDAGKIGLSTENELNYSHIYYMLEERHLNVLKPILLSLQKSVAECIGTPWRIVNVRVWETLAKSNQEGPTGWHTDCMPPSLLKVMIYPYGANEEIGTTELQLSNGSSIVNGDPGTWIVFKNSEIVHRGRPPKNGKRLVIEISLLPSLTYDLDAICGGLNGRFPKLPWQYPRSFAFRYSDKPRGINIGGGPTWEMQGWINLEEVISSMNPQPFYLSPHSRFPVENESIQTVYTSHALEHLPISTVKRALSESNRALQPDGDLVIKIPDYDKVLDCWRRGEHSFFYSYWGIESVTAGWAAQGICDCLDHRAAMIVCSIFGQGNPFGPAESKPEKKAIPGYFGPTFITVKELRDLIDPSLDLSPAALAEALCAKMRATDNDFRFCHQSAWSREELKNLLSEYGFEVVSFDYGTIMNAFGNIRDIGTMREISIFCWAKKKSSI